MRKLILLTGITLTFLLPRLYAQQEQSLHFVNNIWQSNMTNPAIKSSDKIQLLLPGIYYSTHSPDFTLRELLKTDEAGNLNLSEVTKNRIQPRNRLNAHADIMSLGVSYPISKKLTLSLYQTTNSHFSLDLDGDVLKLVLVDNIDYVGKTLNLHSQMNGSIYSEIGLGGVYSVNDKINIGVRLKSLNGISGIFTVGGESRLTLLNTDYAMKMNNNMNIVTYSIPQVKDINTPKEAFNESLFGKNRGCAFDVGTTMTFGKLNFALSFVDVAGFIRWKYEGKRYASFGDQYFKGINSFNISLENPSIGKSSLKDNLKEIIDFDETDNPRYIEKIPVKFYFSSTYQLTTKLSVGALVYQEDSRYSGIQKGFALNTTYKFMESLQLGSTFGYRNGRLNNWGMHLVTQLGPVQLFGVTDNIISVFRPYATKSANGRIGLNILFNRSGRVKPPSLHNSLNIKGF